MSSPNIPEEKTEMSGSHASSRSQSFNGNALSLEPLFPPSSGVPLRTGSLLGQFVPHLTSLREGTELNVFPQLIECPVTIVHLIVIESKRFPNAM